MFKIHVEIYSDGDFSCVDYSHAPEKVDTIFITNGFKIALKKLESYLENVSSSLSGREYVIKEVSNALNECVQAIRNKDFESEDVKVYHDTGELFASFDLGNQTIDISIVKVTQTKENGVIKIVEKF